MRIANGSLRKRSANRTTAALRNARPTIAATM
jgi:hypothetical protein